MEQTLHLCAACGRLLSAGLSDLQVVRVRFKFHLWMAVIFCLREMLYYMAFAIADNFVEQKMFLLILNLL